MALSSRAHAFSVEALVGKPSKRKIEDCKEEKRTNDALEQEEENVPSATIEADELGKRSKLDSLIRKSPGVEKSGSENDIQVGLQGSDLWKRFHEIGTEMIITKAGRRMFPSVRVKAKELDPFKQYYIAMDIVPVDSKRYRYVYHSSQWMVAGNTDHSCITPRLYIHPDSPCSGETWMRQVISFDRVKLTNNEMDDKGHIILQSMHKYTPRVHVILHDPRFDLSQIQSLPAEGVTTFSFRETEFTTVTAYQNQQITKLKIDRNPFAKGFRDPGRNRGVLDGILDTYPWRTPLSFDFKPFGLETQVGSSSSHFSCGTLSPLNGQLSPSCSPPSFLLSRSSFGLPCSDSLGLPLCYKMCSPMSMIRTRPFSLPGHDRLQGNGSPGLPALTDFPFLSSLGISALRSGKGGDCRGHCLQGPPGSPHQPHLHRVHTSGNVGLPPSPLQHIPAPLPSPYNLYGYKLPVTSRLARNFKLAENSLAASSRDERFAQAPYHSTVNHCL
ncbi:T-box mRNAion factor TBX22-like [Huso huso]|uniref:T-box mRNAion factor TBX22-like n=1 Tax=Huso huso TaxID=61971 RepID=A0ABR0YMK7_HUSHU